MHIHIENTWRLGDEIMAIPFYSLVRRRFPEAGITVAVNYPGLLHDNKDVIVDNERGEFDCDRYIFAKDDGRSVSRLEHLCRRFRVPFEPIPPVVKVPDEGNLIQRDGSALVIAYSCSAGWPCKSWFPEAARELASVLETDIPGAILVEVGKDGPKVGVGEDFTDRLTIEETARVLSECDLYIGPDSGLVHLALALGIPTVGLYGPVRPEVMMPERPNLHPVLSSAKCQGCWTDGRMVEPGVCPLGVISDSAADYPCMRVITAELAMETINKAGAL